MSDLARKHRQIAYWRLLGAAFGMQDISTPFERMVGELAGELDLPTPLLDAKMGVDVLLSRYPKLRPHFEALREITGGMESAQDAGPEQTPAPDRDGDQAGQSSPATSGTRPGLSGATPDLTRTLVFSKLVLNVFGPSTLTQKCTAQQYSQWCDDVAAFEKCFGYAPG